MDDDRKKPRKPGGKPFAAGSRDRPRAGAGKPPGSKPFRAGGKKPRLVDNAGLPSSADVKRKSFRKPSEASAGEGSYGRPYVRRERVAEGAAPRPGGKARFGSEKPRQRKPVEGKPMEGTGERGGQRAQAAPAGERREWKARPEGRGSREGRPGGERKAYTSRDSNPAAKVGGRDGAGSRGREGGFARRPRDQDSQQPAETAHSDAGIRNSRPVGPNRGERRFVKRTHSGPPGTASRAIGGRKPALPGDKPFRRATPEASESTPGERIAKRLARVGIASRRDAEELIAAGRVRVNGKVLASPAFNVMPDDTIELDGGLLPPIERTRLFLFHKPAGVVTTNRDPEGRRTVFDVLPDELPRLITVGRLDINTEGLLLLTNDGGLARVLELPATGWLRRYRARVHGKVDEAQLAGLKDGMSVGGVFYGSIDASLEREQGSNAWLSIGLREGKNREVKNILGALGLDVTRLIRVSFGPFQLNELPEGHVQELKGRTLRDQLGERLIEESGANFDADIQKPFSNAPRRRERDRPAEAAAPRRLRDDPPVRIGEGGLIKRRERRENTRDEALGKLSTRPERAARGERGERPFRDGDDKPFRDKSLGAKPGAKPFGLGKPGRGDKKSREQRPIEPPGGRKANVWMAPGARPQGAGRGDDAVRKPKSDFAGSSPSSPAGPSARQRGEKGAPRDADAPRFPSKRAEGKGGGPSRGSRPGGPRAPRKPKDG